MFDVNPKIISQTLESCWRQDTLEHYQEDEEYFALDFSKEKDARYAIRKWLKQSDWSDIPRKNLYRETLRYIITSGKGLEADIWLPGIDDENEYPSTDQEDFNSWKKNYKNFLLILWDEWFHERFVPADLSQYRERIDDEFVQFPHMPELWKKPIYKD